MEPEIDMYLPGKNSSHSPITPLKKAKEKLLAFTELNHALFQEPSLFQFANKSLDYAFHVVGGQAGSLLLASPKRKTLQFFISKGIKPVPRWTQVRWNLGIAGYVFHSGHSEFVSDASHDPRHLPEIDQMTGYKTQNLIATPIRYPEGKSLGVVEILNVAQGSPNEEDQEFLQMLATLLCLALHRDWGNENSHREAKDNFVKDCAHDMKNMLTPILGGKDFLKEELVEIFGKLPYRDVMQMEKSLIICKESLDIIDRNAIRLQRKAKDLVDHLNGLTSLKELKPCDIKKITSEALETLSFLTQKKEVTTHLDGLEELPLILADERKLFSVLYNLFHNAVSAIQRGGSIGLHAYQKSNTLCLKIWDNGPGIPQHEMDGIFSHKSLKMKSLSNSYGMKSVRNAVEEHGGHLKIESRIGMGTTFHISLPIQDPTNNPASGPFEEKFV